MQDFVPMQVRQSPVSFAQWLESLPAGTIVRLTLSAGPVVTMTLRDGAPAGSLRGRRLLQQGQSLSHDPGSLETLVASAAVAACDLVMRASGTAGR